MDLTVEKTRALWHAERRKGIGGSDATILMSGDAHAILDLWLVKTGQKEPDDLSWVLPVQIGVVTEALNLAWLAHVTGWNIEAGVPALVHPEHYFMRCNLDGRAPDHIVEAKHVNAFANVEEVAQKYMAQLHHNMAVAGKTKAALTIFKGTQEHHWFEVPLDEWYLADLIDRERKFWDCVESNTPPVDMPEIKAPVAPDRWRTVDMSGSNEWAAFSADWLKTRDAKKTYDAAEKGIKALVEADVGLAHGYGIECKRNKAGALKIGATK